MATEASPVTVIRYNQPPGETSASNQPGFPPPKPSMSGALPDTWQPTKVADTGRPGQPFSKPVRVYSPQEIPANIKTARSSVEYGLKELINLQQRRSRIDGISFLDQFRLQSANVLGDLNALRGELAVLIPAVRAIWKRPQHDSKSSNSTEYAFRKSKSLITRILSAVRSTFGGLASVTFFVFAVLYVFQNEVSLRVAKTVSKRLKRLHTKVERGDQEITENDLKLLRGWRWRVLL
ncbi:hypothetical protein J7T55_013058 [Diaporthe amygdali]|uniref:uncharacterized protein n=1 Tax=Phomopsis amygdali TaxID=1214568 RepID=UPI0022FDF6DF|nr:uncharacterized protein J7T55_013058 [Diaporthe amygdali]KAJ0118803.1 hypothetical protein J7T55_013058 [Diaporthe amygdali]